MDNDGSLGLGREMGMLDKDKGSEGKLGKTGQSPSTEI